MVEFQRRKLWKHWKVFHEHAKIRPIICWRICHPSVLFGWKTHVMRSILTSEKYLGTNWLQQHSFPQNLHQVNVHTITEHIVLFVKKNLILNWQVNVRMYHQLDRRGNKKMQASQDIKNILRGEDRSTVTWGIFKDSIC